MKVALERQVGINQKLSQEKEQLMFKLRHRDSCPTIHLSGMVQEIAPRWLWSHDRPLHTSVWLFIHQVTWSCAAFNWAPQDQLRQLHWAMQQSPLLNHITWSHAHLSVSWCFTSVRLEWTVTDFCFTSPSLTLARSRVHIVLWPTAACASSLTLEAEARPEELHRPFFRALQELLSVRGPAACGLHGCVTSPSICESAAEFVARFENFVDSFCLWLKIQQSQRGDLAALKTLLLANMPETWLDSEISWKLIGPSLRPLLLTLRRRSGVLRDVGLVSMCDMMSTSVSAYRAAPSWAWDQVSFFLPTFVKRSRWSSDVRLPVHRETSRSSPGGLKAPPGSPADWRCRKNKHFGECFLKLFLWLQTWLLHFPAGCRRKNRGGGSRFSL